MISVLDGLILTFAYFNCVLRILLSVLKASTWWHDQVQAAKGCQHHPDFSWESISGQYSQARVNEVPSSLSTSLDPQLFTGLSYFYNSNCLPTVLYFFLIPLLLIILSLLKKKKIMHFIQSERPPYHLHDQFHSPPRGNYWYHLCIFGDRVPWINRYAYKNIQYITVLCGIVKNISVIMMYILLCNIFRNLFFSWSIHGFASFF